MGGVPIKATFSQVCGGLWLLKKKNSFGEKRNLKNLLQRDFLGKPKRKLFLSRKRIHPYQKSNKSQEQKQSSFLLLSLLKVAFKPKKGKDLNFQAKNKSKRWTPSEGKSILHQHLFLLLSLLFFVLFNFLFDSIYFYFCVDYLLIIFLLFLIFWWVEWCKSMVEMHKDPWYAMG